MDPTKPRPNEPLGELNDPAANASELFTSIESSVNKQIATVSENRLTPGEDTSPIETQWDKRVSPLDEKTVEELDALAHAVGQVASPGLPGNTKEQLGMLVSQCVESGIDPVPLKLTRASFEVQEHFWNNESYTRLPKMTAYQGFGFNIEAEQSNRRDEAHTITLDDNREVRTNSEWGVDMYRNGYHNGAKLTDLFPSAKNANELEERFVKELIQDGLTPEEVEQLSYRSTQAAAVKITEIYKEQEQKKGASEFDQIKGEKSRLHIVTKGHLRVFQARMEMVRKAVHPVHDLTEVDRRQAFLEITNFCNEDPERVDTYIGISSQQVKKAQS